MKIEFFHDTICSFCFPMSYKMRIIAKEMPDAEIIHRSFSLVWSKAALIEMYGSMENAKNELLEHWEDANMTDPLRRFNAEGMRAADFDFPTSKNALLASKAAGIIGGEAAYWDLFDELQKAMFMNSKDISQIEEIEECVKAVGLDFDAWQNQFNAPDTLAKVRADISLGRRYRVTVVPTLIVNEKIKLPGSLSLEELRSSLANVK